MNTTATRLLTLACGGRAAAQSSCVASADETEIFVGTGNAVSNERPNILFIIDTSGSMDTAVLTQVPFNPATTYRGTCDDRPGLLSTPAIECEQSAELRNNNNSVPVAAFKCCRGVTRHGGSSAITSRIGRRSGAPTAAADAMEQRHRTMPALRPGWSAARTPASTATASSDQRLWAADGNNGPWSANVGPSDRLGLERRQQRLRVLHPATT